MKFSVFQTSRKGGRQNNEDRMGYCYTKEAALFLLADGMGGHAEGEVAAQLALQAMAAQFQAEAKPLLKKPADFLSSAVLHAHHQILNYSADKGLLDTPRTTIVAVLVQQGQAIWVHCGDSRLYVFRDGQMLLRTRDHSYLEQGEHFVPKHSHINRNVLFTCLGSPSRPIFDISEPMVLEQQDRVMLCSDGLWGNVEDDIIACRLANTDRPLSELLPDLVELALKNGGSGCDNTTTIAFSWELPATEDAHIETDSISGEVFASTIQSIGWDSDGDGEFDEDDIERSIAEINAAIERSNPLKKA